MYVYIICISIKVTNIYVCYIITSIIIYLFFKLINLIYINRAQGGEYLDTRNTLFNFVTPRYIFENLHSHYSG